MLTITGWNKRVDYEPGTGSRQLFPKMHLETCGGPLSGVKAMVELQTNHIGKGCDRETYSEKSLQKLCGMSNERKKVHKNIKGERWKRNCLKCLIEIVWHYLRVEDCESAKG